MNMFRNIQWVGAGEGVPLKEVVILTCRLEKNMRKNWSLSSEIK